MQRSQCLTFFENFWPFVYLFHQAGFPFAESGVASEFVVDEFHLYLDPSLGLLAMGVRLELALLRAV